MKIVYVACRSTRDPLPVLREHVQVLAPFPRLGLVATAQHLHALAAVKKELDRKGHETLICGQVLGCMQDRALGHAHEVDAFIYVGSGRFHPMGMAVGIDRPVFLLNPLSGTLDRIGEDEIRTAKRRRKGRLAKALAAGVYGVMVSTKSGQSRLDEALRLKRRLEAKGRKAYILAGDNLTPDNLLPFGVDCLVNTACPRLVDDHFHVPVVNAAEFEPYIG